MLAVSVWLLVQAAQHPDSVWNRDKMQSAEQRGLRVSCCPACKPRRVNTDRQRSQMNRIKVTMWYYKLKWPFVVRRGGDGRCMRQTNTGLSTTDQVDFSCPFECLTGELEYVNEKMGINWYKMFLTIWDKTEHGFDQRLSVVSWFFGVWSPNCPLRLRKKKEIDTNLDTCLRYFPISVDLASGWSHIDSLNKKRLVVNYGSALTAGAFPAPRSWHKRSMFPDGWHSNMCMHEQDGKGTVRIA